MIYSPVHSNIPIKDFSKEDLNDENINDIEKGIDSNNTLFLPNILNNKKIEEIFYELVIKYIFIFFYLAIGITNLILSTNKYEYMTKKIHNPDFTLSVYYIITGIFSLVYFILMFEKFIMKNAIVDKLLFCDGAKKNNTLKDSRMIYYYLICFIIITANQIMTIFGVIILNRLVKKNICQTSILYYLLFQIIVRLVESLLYICSIFYYPIIFCYCALYGFNG